MHFNPPTPCGVGLSGHERHDRGSKISIHPPRAGWDISGEEQIEYRFKFQSTHPVRGGALFSILPTRLFISIHPPRAGWDAMSIMKQRGIDPFQSTHPVRGGTSSQNLVHFFVRYFNPPTPCGVGRPLFHPANSPVYFNPPTPCGVGLFVVLYKKFYSNFNPPTPCGVGPSIVLSALQPPAFQSTHPVRGGTNGHSKMEKKKNFNPPTPCGVGRRVVFHVRRRTVISIHPPRAGWDIDRCKPASVRQISIHPPRAGWDFKDVLKLTHAKPFQSTHPVRGGTTYFCKRTPNKLISIHPPRAGWDRRKYYDYLPAYISIHPPRAGWDSVVRCRLYP